MELGFDGDEYKFPSMDEQNRAFYPKLTFAKFLANESKLLSTKYPFLAEDQIKHRAREIWKKNVFPQIATRDSNTSENSFYEKKPRKRSSSSGNLTTNKEQFPENEKTQIKRRHSSLVPLGVLMTSRGQKTGILKRNHTTNTEFRRVSFQKKSEVNYHLPDSSQDSQSFDNKYNKETSIYNSSKNYLSRKQARLSAAKEGEPNVQVLSTKLVKQHSKEKSSCTTISTDEDDVFMNSNCTWSYRSEKTQCLQHITDCSVDKSTGKRAQKKKQSLKDKKGYQNTKTSHSRDKYDSKCNQIKKQKNALLNSKSMLKNNHDTVEKANKDSWGKKRRNKSRNNVSINEIHEKSSSIEHQSNRKTTSTHNYENLAVESMLSGKADIVEDSDEEIGAILLTRISVHDPKFPVTWTSGDESEDSKNNFVNSDATKNNGEMLKILANKPSSIYESSQNQELNQSGKKVKMKCSRSLYLDNSFHYLETEKKCNVLGKTTNEDTEKNKKMGDGNIKEKVNTNKTNWKDESKRAGKTHNKTQNECKLINKSMDDKIKQQSFDSTANNENKNEDSAFLSENNITKNMNFEKEFDAFSFYNNESEIFLKSNLKFFKEPEEKESESNKQHSTKNLSVSLSYRDQSKSHLFKKSQHIKHSSSANTEGNATLSTKNRFDCMNHLQTMNTESVNEPSNVFNIGFATSLESSESEKMQESHDNWNSKRKNKKTKNRKIQQQTDCINANEVSFSFYDLPNAFPERIETITANVFEQRLPTSKSSKENSYLNDIQSNTSTFVDETILKMRKCFSQISSPNKDLQSKPLLVETEDSIMTDQMYQVQEQSSCINSDVTTDSLHFETCNLPSKNMILYDEFNAMKNAPIPIGPKCITNKRKKNKQIKKRKKSSNYTKKKAKYREKMRKKKKFKQLLMRKEQSSNESLLLTSMKRSDYYKETRLLPQDIQKKENKKLKKENKKLKKENKTNKCLSSLNAIWPTAFFKTLNAQKSMKLLEGSENSDIIENREFDDIFDFSKNANLQEMKQNQIPPENSNLQVSLPTSINDDFPYSGDIKLNENCNPFAFEFSKNSGFNTAKEKVISPEISKSQVSMLSSLDNDLSYSADIMLNTNCDTSSPDNLGIEKLRAQTKPKVNENALGSKYHTELNIFTEEIYFHDNFADDDFSFLHELSDKNALYPQDEDAANSPACPVYTKPQIKNQNDFLKDNCNSIQQVKDRSNFFINTSKQSELKKARMSKSSDSALFCSPLKTHSIMNKSEMGTELQYILTDVLLQKPDILHENGKSEESISVNSNEIGCADILNNSGINSYFENRQLFTCPTTSNDEKNKNCSSSSSKKTDILCQKTSEIYNPKHTNSNSNSFKQINKKLKTCEQIDTNSFSMMSRTQEEARKISVSPSPKQLKNRNTSAKKIRKNQQEILCNFLKQKRRTTVTNKENKHCYAQEDEINKHVKNDWSPLTLPPLQIEQEYENTSKLIPNVIENENSKLQNNEENGSEYNKKLLFSNACDAELSGLTGINNYFTADPSCQNEGLVQPEEHIYPNKKEVRNLLQGRKVSKNIITSAAQTDKNADRKSSQGSEENAEIGSIFCLDKNENGQLQRSLKNNNEILRRRNLLMAMNDDDAFSISSSDEDVGKFKEFTGKSVGTGILCSLFDF